MTTMPAAWLRAITLVDRATVAGSNLAVALLRELPCLFVAPTDRETVTEWAYSRHVRYIDGWTERTGLFDWEVEAIVAHPFPCKGRILLGGAGAGREILTLAERGYEVVAFEPSALATVARSRVEEVSALAEVHRASYRDVIRALHEGDGPLAEAFRETFDGIVLGWGSLSHVVSYEERRDLFRSLRTLAPTAPLLCSFNVSVSDGLGPGGRADRVLRSLRRALRGRRVDIDLRFAPGNGFSLPLRRAGLERLATETGYAIVQYREEPFAHAVLEPSCHERGVR